MIIKLKENEFNALMEVAQNASHNSILLDVMMKNPVKIPKDITVKEIQDFNKKFDGTFNITSNTSKETIITVTIDQEYICDCCTVANAYVDMVMNAIAFVYTQYKTIQNQLIAPIVNKWSGRLFLKKHR